MASPVVPPPDAPVVPSVISLDFLTVPLVDVPVAHPHVVAPIGGSETTSSTAMQDPIAAHMSPIHEKIHTFSFWRERCIRPQKVTVLSQILFIQKIFIGHYFWQAWYSERCYLGGSG